MRRDSPADARLLAYHEAGHVVAAYVLKRPFGPVALRAPDPADPAGTASISAVNPVPGMQGALAGRSLEEAERDVMMLLAGVEAEAILTGYCDWFVAQTDRERAEALLAQMLAAGYRASPHDTQEAELVSGLADDPERAAWELVSLRAHELVHSAPAQSAIAALAAALLTHQTLSVELAQRAIRQGIAAADPELE